MIKLKNLHNSKTRVITGDYEIDLLLGISLEALKDAVRKPKRLDPDELKSAETFVRDCPTAYCDFLKMDTRLYQEVVSEVCNA